ncbi:MAG: hypothetical protein K2X08_00905 [Chlamydiales bacterium]|nr:hypothetical protein [Chlamydiales bacterium]
MRVASDNIPYGSTIFENPRRQALFGNGRLHLNIAPSTFLRLEKKAWSAIFVSGFILGLLLDYGSYPGLAASGIFRVFPILNYLWWIPAPVFLSAYLAFLVVVWQMLGNPMSNL